jgi:hypothetical protein
MHNTWALLTPSRFLHDQRMNRKVVLEFHIAYVNEQLEVYIYFDALILWLTFRSEIQVYLIYYTNPIKDDNVEVIRLTTHTRREWVYYSYIEVHVIKVHRALDVYIIRHPRFMNFCFW